MLVTCPELLPEAAMDGTGGSKSAGSGEQCDVPDAPIPENLDVAEWDGGPVPENPLQSADATLRLLTTFYTPLEFERIQDSKVHFQLNLKQVSKVIKHWGNNMVVKDVRDILCSIASKKWFRFGEACEPGTVEFAMCRSLLHASRRPLNAGDTQACFCLPPFFMEGCRHRSPPVFTQGTRLEDIACTQCSKCLRCGKLLSENVNSS